MRKTTQSDATDLSERKNSKHDKQQNVYSKRVTPLKLESKSALKEHEWIICHMYEEGFVIV